MFHYSIHISNSILQLTKLNKHAPDFVDDSASAKSCSKSGLILTESITTVCKVRLLEINNVTALKNLSGKFLKIG